jgi:hypothetical protein
MIGVITWNKNLPEIIQEKGSNNRKSFFLLPQQEAPGQAPTKSVLIVARLIHRCPFIAISAA